MVVVLEYRIPLPISVPEYQIAQLYAVAKASIEATEAGKSEGGSGVEVLINEPYENEMGKGQFTKKIYHLGKSLPSFMQKILPASALLLYEESWNAYPNCKTVITSPYLKDSLTFIVESKHLPDTGGTENVHNLDRDKLGMRQVIPIDIAFDEIDKKKYKAEEDPKIFHSERTGRGPLSDPNWKFQVDPVMTCYKLVTFEFKWWGLQTKIEKTLADFEKGLFTQLHRQIFCWIDKWYGLTIDDIRKMEADAKRKMDAIKEGREVEPDAPAAGPAPVVATTTAAAASESAAAKLDASREEEAPAQPILVVKDASGRPVDSNADLDHSESKSRDTNSRRSRRSTPGMQSQESAYSDRSSRSRRSHEGRPAADQVNGLSPTNGERRHHRERSATGGSSRRRHGSGSHPEQLAPAAAEKLSNPLDRVAGEHHRRRHSHSAASGSGKHHSSHHGSRRGSAIHLTPGEQPRTPVVVAEPVVAAPVAAAPAVSASVSEPPREHHHRHHKHKEKPRPKGKGNAESESEGFVTANEKVEGNDDGGADSWTPSD